MPRLDLQALIASVRAILADPHAPVPTTGQAVLDNALAALAQRRRSGEPAIGTTLPFWLVSPHADEPAR